ncbi:MAG: M23 family metallopeptidase [Candidatus Sericytochromatia bacterium]|nr:M23 family metallopeptidase [Candidatus Sericytochromatia bacterium]
MNKPLILMTGICLLFLTRLSARAAELDVRGAELRQGQALQVRFRAEQAGPFRVQVAGQTHTLFEEAEAYQGFVGLPADQKPGGYTLRILDETGQTLASQKIEVYPGSFYTQHIRFPSPPLTPEQEAVVQAERQEMDTARASRSPDRLWQSAFAVPVPHRVSAVYGTRRYLNGKYNGYHGGVDFASPMGYPVKAPADGRVVLARYFSKYNANGNTVFLDHGLGVTSVYIHLSKVLVQPGQLIRKGEALGLIGSSGRSTGPHLHWGLYLNGQNTDGLHWIRFTQQL